MQHYCILSFFCNYNIRICAFQVKPFTIESIEKPEESLKIVDSSGIIGQNSKLVCDMTLILFNNSGGFRQELNEKGLLICSIELFYRAWCLLFLGTGWSIELLLEPLGIHAPVVVQNMCVPLRDHRGLCVAGIPLDALDVAAAQHQLVGSAGVADAVEHHFLRRSSPSINLMNIWLIVDPPMGLLELNANTLLSTFFFVFSKYNRRECFRHSHLLSSALVPVLEREARKAKS